MDFPGWEARTSSPPSGYAHDLCIKPLKVTKIVAGSMFSKGIGVHSHLKTLCRIFFIAFVLEVPLVTTKTALR